MSASMTVVLVAAEVANRLQIACKEVAGVAKSVALGVAAEMQAERQSETQPETQPVGCCFWFLVSLDQISATNATRLPTLRFCGNMRANNRKE